MRGRSHWTERERSARSRLCQLFHEQDVIAGSLVTMKRLCGKPGCRCARGEKHVSLYVAFSVKGKRTMVIIPAGIVEEVRTAVEAYQRAKQLQQELSVECFARLMRSERE